MMKEMKVNEMAEMIEMVDQKAGKDAISLKKGDTVKGITIKVADNQVRVDIGYQYDGIIPARELTAVTVDPITNAIQVGQEVTCKVMSVNDKKKYVVLSKRQVDSDQAWDKMQEHFEVQDVFEVTVADVVKGGVVADVGVRAFIPKSRMERHYVKDLSDYKGHTLRVKVKEIDREQNKLILSQKDVLEAEFEVNKLRVIESLTQGQEIEGTVQRLVKFGIFVEIAPGVEGLVHISQIAWNHVEKPSDVVSEGQKVKVKILRTDPINGKINLSMKAVQPSPWDQVVGRIKKGDILTGKVKRLLDFGAFVEVASGVEGLVHISQIAHRRIATPHEILKEGQSIQVKVLDFNPAEKRISLSIKETEEAPSVAQGLEKRDDGMPHNPNVSLHNQTMSVTLGERLGHMLNKFKNE